MQDHRETGTTGPQLKPAHSAIDTSAMSAHGAVVENTASRKRDWRGEGGGFGGAEGGGRYVYAQEVASCSATCRYGDLRWRPRTLQARAPASLFGTGRARRSSRRAYLARPSRSTSPWSKDSRTVFHHQLTHHLPRIDYYPTLRHSPASPSRFTSTAPSPPPSATTAHCWAALPAAQGSSRTAPSAEAAARQKRASAE